MRKTNISRRGGFTLLENMIVLAIIALIALVALPQIFRARTRAQASLTLQICRTIEFAKDQWAIENNKSPGAAVAPAELLPYLKRGTKTHTDIVTTNGVTDAVGAPIAINGVDVHPKVSVSTKLAFTSAAITANYWNPY